LEGKDMMPSASGESALNDASLQPSPIGEASKVELLCAMDILQDMSDRDLRELRTAMPLRVAPRGTVFYGPGGPDVLFLLISGRVDLARESRDGRHLTLAIVGEKTFFGEMSVIGQRMVGTCAVALEDSVTCALSRDDVQHLMTDHPSVPVRIVEGLARRLQQTRDALEQMAFNDVTGRVAGLLLRLADDKDGVEGYSHQELSAMIGCLRESLTVVLDRFKESGALSIGRRRVDILDRSQLDLVVQQRASIPELVRS
jgi:CRP/FNR family transcriptional regulator